MSVYDEIRRHIALTARGHEKVRVPTAELLALVDKFEGLAADADRAEARAKTAEARVVELEDQLRQAKRRSLSFQ